MEKFEALDKRIENIEGDIKIIRENHLHRLETDMATTKTNTEWLMKFFWILATASIGGFVTSIMNLLK